MKKQNVEQLFKDTFSNYEADVNPSMWANIEQGLSAAPGSSPVSKPAGFFSKISLNTILLVSAISATLIGTTIYLSSDKSNSTDTLVQSVQAQPQIAQNHSSAPSQVTPVITDAAPVASPATPVAGNEPKSAPQKQAAPGKAVEKVQTPAVAHQAPVATTEQKAENNSASSSDNGVNVSIPDGSSSDKANHASHGNSEAAHSLSPENGNVEFNRIYSNLDVTENNQPDAGKTASGYIVEQASGAPENTITEGGSVQLSENEEQFRCHIPNSFTPNGDGTNDYFQPVVNVSPKDYEMTIYDRYGFEIFKTRNLAFGWDGKLKDGNIAATAVYVYIIKVVDFKGEEHNYIRDFLLFK
jgi:gliding motility-associated-like protein